MPAATASELVMQSALNFMVAIGGCLTRLGAARKIEVGGSADDMLNLPRSSRALLACLLACLLALQGISIPIGNI